MSARRRRLNGTDWTMKGYIDGEWKAKRAFHPECADTQGWAPAMVPGSVQHDLWQQGVVPDPYYAMNSLQLEWVPTRTWVYRTTFTIAEEEAKQRLVLHFQGIDHDAEIYLDGDKLGEGRAMFIPASFELTGRLEPDKAHHLAVVLLPAPDSESQLGSTWAVRSTKTRMNYWWDFCPRMIHLGIWDDVQLEVSGTARLENVYIRPELSRKLDYAEISVSSELSSRSWTKVSVETVITSQGKELARTCSSHAVAPGHTALNTLLRVDSPRLWWPNGDGEAALYEAVVKVIAEDSVLSDEYRAPFGIRRIEWAYNEKADPEALPYTFVVNGRKTYIKGWNWVPADVLYGTVSDESLDHYVELAHRAGVNLLRVWGGGLIEKDRFYDLCDRYGIMVWQEFNQSSSSLDNKPSENPEYIRMMVEEAKVAIRRKRNHPSLALWCGGNELEGWDKLPLNDEDPVLAALKQVVETHDPGRLWLPCSSSGKMPFNGINTLRNHPERLHDVHGPWHHQGLKDHYNIGACLLHSEFGAEGLTNLKSIERTVPESSRWPVTLEEPVWYHLGAWWVKEDKWREMFGEIGDLETMVEATQYVQAEAVRYALERNRTRQFQNSGSLPWQFNEPHPMAACTSAIDYYGRPKALYYAVAGAYEEVLVSAKVPMQVWAGEPTFHAELDAVQSGTQAIEDAVLTCTLLDADGRPIASGQIQSTLPANSHARFGAFSCPLDKVTTDLFILDLTLTDPSGRTRAHNRYLFSKTADLAPLLNQAETELTVRAEHEVDHTVLTLTNTGAAPAMFIRLDDARPLGSTGAVYFSDNHLSLLPGEQRQVRVDWSRVPPAERRLEVKGLNTPKVVVEA